MTKTNPTKLLRACEICGVSFFAWKCKVKIGYGRFCSKSCQVKWQTRPLPLGARRPNGRIVRDPIEVARVTKETGKRWRQANRERLKEKQRHFRKLNPGYDQRFNRKQYELKYRTSEKGRLKVNFQRSRYVRRHLKAAGNATSDQLKSRWDFYGGRCYLCGANATAMDHVISLNKGGSNWPANLRPVCKSCNSHKSDLSLSEFIKRRSLKSQDSTDCK